MRVHRLIPATVVDNDTITIRTAPSGGHDGAVCRSERRRAVAAAPGNIGTGVSPITAEAWINRACNGRPSPCAGRGCSSAVARNGHERLVAADLNNLVDRLLNHSAVCNIALRLNAVNHHNFSGNLAQALFALLNCMRISNIFLRVCFLRYGIFDIFLIADGLCHLHAKIRHRVGDQKLIAREQACFNIRVHRDQILQGDAVFGGNDDRSIALDNRIHLFAALLLV